MIGKIGAALGIAVPMGGAVWYFATHDAEAQSERIEQDQIEARQEKIEEAVDVLKSIHVRQETVADAEDALIKKLCAEGKLPSEECIDG